MTTTETNSLEETQLLAKKFAQNFKDNGGLILLSGNLGAGKTTFTQGFVKSFGIDNKVTSPTFLLTRQYQIPNSDRWIFHLDLYRLAEPINLSETGIQEMLDTIKDNIVLIEWSEKIISQLENIEYHEVNLQRNSEENRTISISHKTL
jgi:tRNA threonylcarbamoyladenosine biosynthesis protein TsaE